MPSSRPRISVVLTEEQHHLLKRLGALQGRSQAAVLMDCLETLTPPLMAQMVLLEAVDAIGAGIDQQEAVAAVEAVIHSLDLASIMQLDQLDEVRSKIAVEMEALKVKFTPGDRGVGGVAGGVSASHRA